MRLTLTKPNIMNAIATELAKIKQLPQDVQGFLSINENGVVSDRDGKAIATYSGASEACCMAEEAGWTKYDFSAHISTTRYRA